MVLVHCTTPQCNLCMKFEVTSFNTFEVMLWTRLRDARTDRQGDSSKPRPPTQTSFVGYKNVA